MRFYEWLDRTIIDPWRTESAYEDIRRKESKKYYKQPEAPNYPKLSRIEMG